MSFGGNCVDQTNVFVSLSRIAGYGSRYLSLKNNNPIGHEIGQILVDGIWITVDNSAATSNNGIYTKMSECRYIGNKNYLAQSNYYVDKYICVYYGDNRILEIIINDSSVNSLIKFQTNNIQLANQLEKFKINMT